MRFIISLIDISEMNKLIKTEAFDAIPLKVEYSITKHQNSYIWPFL